MRIPWKLGRRLWQAHLGFQDHEGVLSAAAIAYYVALSFFPLLLVLLTGLASLLEWTQFGQEAQQEVIATIEHQASPDLAQQVQRSLNAVKIQAPASGPIGFVALIISALAIFSQLDTAFDRIWRQPIDPHATWMSWVQKLVYQRLKALGMLLAVGGFIVMAMVTTTLWSAVERALEPQFSQGKWFQWFHWASSAWINLLLNWFAFTMIYHVVPKVRVRWWEAARGGFLAAVLWELGRQALGAYFTHLNYPSAYGIIGSFIAVMLWAYYAALVILFGAEYVRVIGEERQVQKELPLGD